MKKLSVLAMTMALSMAAVGCAKTAPATETTAAETTAAETTAEETTTVEETTEAADSEAKEVLSYDEYVAADLDSEVTVETYVQAKQSWWEDKATVYTQDQDGAYFVYNMACSEAEYEIGRAHV